MSRAILQNKYFISLLIPYDIKRNFSFGYFIYGQDSSQFVPAKKQSLVLFGCNAAYTGTRLLSASSLAARAQRNVGRNRTVGESA